MQPVNQSLSEIQRRLENPLSTTTTQAGQMASKSQPMAAGDTQFVNNLFRRLQAIFPAWRQAFATDSDVAEAKRQWTIGLIEAGITNENSINAGLAMARKSKNPFLPSVGQFIGWCVDAKKIQMNFPSIDSVLAQITRYSHARKYPPSNLNFMPEIDPIAYWIYQHTDMHAVRQADEREARRIVSIAYDEAGEKAATGYVFPDPPKLIGEIAPSPSESPEAKAAARKSLSDMKSLLGGPK